MKNTNVPLWNDDERPGVKPPHPVPEEEKRRKVKQKTNTVIVAATRKSNI
jgi:hypothetical protein